MSEAAPPSALKKSDVEKKVNLKESSSHQLEQKSEMETTETGSLDPVIEVNEALASEIFDKFLEVGEYEENPPKIFNIKNVLEPLTIESLNNAIYELGVINMCWPDIQEPVFETRTCFPVSYYTNSRKERLLLAYAESFRRQYYFYFHKKPCYRKPLLLQAPNECGLQKMVCTTIRVTKLCYTGTNTWQGLAELVADYFVYEPLTKPMLHPERIMSPYTALVRRSGNPFEIAHVLVSWLIGAAYDAYVVVGCAKRDVCMNIRYRTVCPDIPDESEKIEEIPEPEEAPRYQLVPLPDFSSKYTIMMDERDRQKKQDELDRIEAERQKKIAELEQPPEDPIDGWRTHAWVLILPGPMGIEEPFFIEPAEGNAYPLDCENYQQIDSIYNNENYYVNIQTLKPVEEEEEEEEEEPADAGKPLTKAEQEYQDKLKAELKAKRKEEQKEKRKQKLKQIEKADAERMRQEGIADNEALEAAQAKKKKKKEKVEEKEGEGEKKKKKKKKKEEQEKVEEEEGGVEEQEVEPEIIWENLSDLSYDLTDLTCWEHLLPGEPFGRRTLIGLDYSDKRTAADSERHLDIPDSWVEKLDISGCDYEQRYPGCHKVIHYKKVLLEKFSRYSETSGIVRRITVYQDYALTIPLLTYEDYSNRDDLMDTVRIDHVKKEVREVFSTGRADHLLSHVYALDAPPQSIEGNRTMIFKWYARNDHLEKVVCTPITFQEYYQEREDLLESRYVEYKEAVKPELKRRLIRVTETYRRNYNVPAIQDVWKRIFNIADDTIDLLYHYAYNFITNDTRNYIKPNLAETGGKILFYPDKTSGYISDPCGKPPRPLNVYYGLCDNIAWEYETNRHIREAETDVNNYLAIRYKELTEPTLYVSLFNTERNEEAQKAYFEMMKMRDEMAAREREADIDPLQPYLARMFGSARDVKKPLTIKEATLVHEQCVNDFKTKQLARQLLVQERFDKLNTEYKAKKLWYLANQFILTPEKEHAYFTMSAELSFRVHSLEVRLTRHKDLSAPRYKVLDDYLRKHPLLQEFHRLRAYYRSAKTDPIF